MSENKPPEAPTSTEVVSKTLAQGSIIGIQAGCVSIIIVIGALVVGILLDRAIGTKYLFTLGLLLVSIPVSLVAMVYSVLRSSRSIRMKSTDSSATPREDKTSDS
jgi:F0F1-type ATP synthase assembly protein I